MPEEKPPVLQALERFTRGEVGPRAIEFDADPLHPGIRDLVSRARDLGLLSLQVPAEQGGCGMDPSGYAAATREIARGCAGVAALLMVHNACTTPLLRAEVALPADGLLAPVLPGPVAADDHGVLRGTARHVPGGLRADAFLVFARRPDDRGPAGCFRVPAGDPGLRRRPLRGQGGLRVCQGAEVTFEGVRGDAVAREDASDSLQETLQTALRIGAAAIALGIADAVRAAAARYASQRYQAGALIIEHQQVRLLLARMGLETRAAGTLLREACEAPGGELPLAAKVVASEAAMRASTDAVQILGGYGYMRDYGIEKRMRDAASLLPWPDVNEEAMLALAVPPRE